MYLEIEISEEDAKVLREFLIWQNGNYSQYGFNEQDQKRLVNVTEQILGEICDGDEYED